MATAVTQQQPTFSALTLFESTLLNAGMLLDSMPLDDLCTALRLINSLHLQLVDIMQPSAADVQRRLLRAEQRLSDQPAAASVGPRQAPAPQLGDRKRHLCQQEEAAGAAEDCVDTKIQIIDSGSSRFEEDADQEEDEQLNGDRSVGVDSSSILIGSEVAPVTGSGGGLDVRALLHETYKKLRGSGPHLFDFSLPWEHPTNQSAASRLIEHIPGASSVEADPDTWKRLYQYYVREGRRVQCNRRTAARCNRMKAKLSRRQKAFESLLPNMSPDELDQFRTVLCRDFTSSDEEDEASSYPGEPDDELASLRVRCLAWESDTVTEMKRRLDQVFYARFATVKQRTQLARCQRHGGAESNRTAPPGAPNWAVRSASAGSSFAAS